MPLINVTKKIDKARAVLGIPEEERIIAACTINPRGAMKRSMAVGLGGAVGALAAARLAPAVSPDAGDQATPGLADRFVEGQNALVLTERRLVLAKLGAMSGKPKEILAEWSRAEVAGIVVEETKLTYPMRIEFPDGTAVEFEGAKGTDPRSLVV